MLTYSYNYCIKEIETETQTRPAYLFSLYYLCITMEKCKLVIILVPSQYYCHTQDFAQYGRVEYACAVKMIVGCHASPQRAC